MPFMTSVENGSNAAMKTPTTPVRDDRMLLAPRLEAYPSSFATASTRAAVSLPTPYRPLIAFDTVATETPAAAATSPIVARCCTGRW